MRYTVIIPFLLIVLVLLGCNSNQVSHDTPSLSFDEAQISYDKDIKVGNTLTVPLIIEYSENESELSYTADKGTVEDNKLTYTTGSSDIGISREINIVVTDGKISDTLIVTFSVYEPSLKFDEAQISYDKDIKVGDTLIVPLYLKYTEKESNLYFTVSKGTVEENKLIYVTDSSVIGFNNEINIVVSDGELTDGFTVTFDVLPFHELKVGDTWKFLRTNNERTEVGPFIYVTKGTTTIEEISQSEDLLMIKYTQTNIEDKYWHTNVEWKPSHLGKKTVRESDFRCALDTSHISKHISHSFLVAMVSELNFQNDSLYIIDKEYETEDTLYIEKTIDSLYLHKYPMYTIQNKFKDYYTSFRKNETLKIIAGIGILERKGTSSHPYAGSSNKYDEKLTAFNDLYICDDTLDLDSLFEVFD